MKKLILVAAMLLSSLQPALADSRKESRREPLPAEELADQLRTRDDDYLNGAMEKHLTAESYDYRHDPIPGRQVVCYAENRRGEIFRGRASRARWAQEIAMDKCFRYSNRCRPLGCEVRSEYGRPYPRPGRGWSY